MWGKRVQAVAFGLMLSMGAALVEASTRAVISRANVEIVDCLLPGKVRKLGMQRTYVTRKKPIKTSASDCGIRGGEYTSFDRASIETALAVWQADAIIGDAKAQYFVGEIFEKGYGSTPDFAKAAKWYKEAAEQGYQPAMLSLGRMHEAGYGVERDLVTAINYYRKAGGLEEDSIGYVSAFKKVRQQDLAEISRLQVDLDQSNARIGLLEKQVADLQGRLTASKAQAAESKRNLKLRYEQLAELQDQFSGVSAPELTRLETELDASRIKLAEQLETINVLRNETASLGTTATKPEDNGLEKTERERSGLAHLAGLAQQKLERLSNSVNQLTELAGAFAKESALLKLSTQFEEQERQLRLEADQLRSQLEQQEAKIEVLKNESATSLVASRKQEEEAANLEIIESTKEELAQRELRISQLEEQLSISQSLATQSDQNNESALRKATELLNKLRADQSKKLASLQSQIRAKDDSLLELKATLGQNRLESQDTVKRLEEQLQLAETKLTQTQLAATASKNKLREAYQDVARLNNKVAALPTEAEYSQAIEFLKLEQQRLSQVEDERRSLSRQVKLVSNERNSLNAKINKLVPNDGISIAIRWPQSNLQKSGEASAPAGSQLSIVGAVFPFAAVEKFTVNNTEQALDKNGLFLASVEVGSKPLTITFAAIDEEGKTVTQNLLIKPDFSAAPELVAQGGLARTRVNFGNYHALVIGNNSYDVGKGWMPLNTAENDAKKISQILREKYDFKVTLKLNTSRNELLLALEEMRKRLTEKDNLLIYYAGHGYMDPQNDQGYWVPVDASSDSAINWVSNATITDQIRAMNARNVMVIADSCYSASLMRSGVVSLRSGLSNEGKMRRLKEDVNAVTRMALSSGGLQPVADAIDNSGHSVFANAIIKQLRQNKSILDGDSLATRVGSDVAAQTSQNLQQVPRYAPLARGGHEGGEFYFVSK